MGHGNAPPVSYRIDGEDRITFVNAAWSEFARENCAVHLSEAIVLGRELWDFVADPETVHLYQLILDKIRETGSTVTVPFRCDGPRLRRFMELRMVPSDAEIDFESRLLRTEPRAEMPLLAAAAARSERLLKICSWCKRMLVDDAWVEVEEAVARLELFEATALPMLTHGICPPCKGRVLEELNA